MFFMASDAVYSIRRWMALVAVVASVAAVGLFVGETHARAATTHIAVQDGDWHDVATWGGEIPILTDTAEAVIPSDVNVTISDSVLATGNIQVDGSLAVNGILGMEGGVVDGEGSLEVGHTGQLLLGDESVLTLVGLTNRGDIVQDYLTPFQVVDYDNGGHHLLKRHSDLSVIESGVNTGVIELAATRTHILVPSGGHFVNSESGQIIQTGLYGISSVRTLDGAIFDNYGTLQAEISASGFAEVHNYGEAVGGAYPGSDGRIVNHKGATWTNDKSFQIFGVFRNDGTLILAERGQTIVFPGTNERLPGLLYNNSGAVVRHEIENQGLVAEGCNSLLLLFEGVVGNAPVDWCDVTPPELQVAIDGTEGLDGWFTSSVALTFRASEPDTGLVASWCLDQYGATSHFESNALDLATNRVGASTDEDGYVAVTCWSESPGGLSELVVALKIDWTPPAVSMRLSRDPNEHGWYSSPVEATLEATDLQSGVASCDGPLSTAGEGPDLVLEGWCYDRAGNGGRAAISSLHVDLTDPVAELVGMESSYLLSEVVDITCTSTDLLSGVESEECSGASGFGYEFDHVRLNPVSVSASDHAGNRASAHGSFTIDVTREGIDFVIDRYVADEKLASDLEGHLDKIEKADDKKKDKGKNDRKADGFEEAVLASISEGDLVEAEGLHLIELVEFLYLGQ